MVTTPFTANAFLLEHLKALSLRYQVSLCLNQSLYKLLPDFESSGIRIINVPIERKLSPLSDLKALKNLLVVFKREKFVSVHTFTPKAGLLGMLAAYLCAVPNRLHTFTGQVWANEYGFKRWFYKNMDRAIVFFSTQVFCDSASQVKFLQVEGVVKNNAISVIGGASISGVNLTRFHPQADQKFDIHFSKLDSQDHFNFLFVGRIARDKGIYDLIEAFIGISQENPKARLWIIGPDEEGLRAQIEYKFPRLNGVLWMGSSTTPEVFMAKADVLVLPSYREGFGTVIIEAAACKTPAIAYRIDGVIDALEDGHSGILVNKGDSKELELAMKSMMLNPSLTVQMGEYAYQRAVSSFCAKKITNNWLELYETVVPVELA
jgi:glycosyltransferase involved in cell wall biosynthesis